MENQDEKEQWFPSFEIRDKNNNRIITSFASIFATDDQVIHMVKSNLLFKMNDQTLLIQQPIKTGKNLFNEVLEDCRGYRNNLNAYFKKIFELDNGQPVLATMFPPSQQRPRLCLIQVFKTGNDQYEAYHCKIRPSTSDIRWLEFALNVKALYKIHTE